MHYITNENMAISISNNACPPTSGRRVMFSPDPGANRCPHGAPLRAHAQLKRLSVHARYMHAGKDYTGDVETDFQGMKCYLSNSGNQQKYERTISTFWSLHVHQGGTASACLHPSMQAKRNLLQEYPYRRLLPTGGIGELRRSAVPEIPQSTASQPLPTGSDGSEDGNYAASQINTVITCRTSSRDRPAWQLVLDAHPNTLSSIP
ncbi:hypothetical protein Vafri_2929, partial [Volvox africanus]